MGLPLPDELVGLIFNYLDIPSLLRCMRVCKLLHSIVSGSTLLSYKIELFASHMEDNELSPTDVATRFNLLREHNRVWNNMEWPSSGSIPMRDGFWEFLGGIFAQATHQNEIFFVQLPCKLKGIAEARWSLPFDFAIYDFTFHNSQDLLVLVELVGNFPDISCKIHLRTLSGGKHHPDADVPQITHELERMQAEITCIMQICGDRFAILFCDQFDTSSQTFFAIWNWRTGHLEVEIRTPNFRSFAFMTEDLILAGIVKINMEPALRVLSIAACVHPIHSLEDMPYIHAFHYPECLGSPEYLLIRSDPTPGWRPPRGSGVPFCCSQRDLIFTISVRYPSDPIQESKVLFVPLSTLLLEIESPISRRDVAWDDWGPSGARMIRREPSETWVCHTYGMKFIHCSPWEARRQIVRVYDFNPYATKTSTVNCPISWKPAASERTAQCEICREEIITALPGRVANFKLGNSRGADWEAVMIGEDHIVMVQANQYSYMAM